MRLLWVSIGLFTLALGLIGAFLPILPTVPFLLLSAFCFARSSKRLYNWLLSHPVFGPPIQDWRKNGAIRRRAKILATASIATAFIVPFALSVAPSVLTLQAVVLVAVLIFIWTRPEA
ncbi:YbaN family protein [Pseudohalocynthiibacter aestuariivivens]|jgi:uncharacterized protein|uniref:YbaN family protein n=1 Tax=Pseudohalocynthiibacter aestuariivivens TaxID=1591409 RepID=A0ABV5JJY7_9RHOB|nr:MULTISPECIES: YbaN family protein [Pseudohalocynthiibacter]MBS9717652.1 YbaN family protein [Pseudohalocynthiibacter aestuariivivens]MCK0102850.1 YbaN family protein [Pseudohalocynthiibacter sp. F2068]